MLSIDRYYIKLETLIRMEYASMPPKSDLIDRVQDMIGR